MVSTAMLPRLGFASTRKVWTSSVVCTSAKIISTLAQVTVEPCSGGRPLRRRRLDGGGYVSDFPFCGSIFTQRPQEERPRVESINQVTIQNVQREDGSVEARGLHTVLNSLRNVELEPLLQGCGWALWSRGRGSEHGWSHQERLVSFGPVPGLQNLVHPAFSWTGCKIFGTYGGWVVHTCGAFSSQDSHSGVQVCRQHQPTDGQVCGRGNGECPNKIGVAKPPSRITETCGTLQVTLTADDTNLWQIEFECRPGSADSRTAVSDVTLHRIRSQFFLW